MALTFTKALKALLIPLPLALAIGMVNSSDATSAIPSPCNIPASISIVGDVVLGAGCTVLTLEDGVEIDVLGARRVELGALIVRVANKGTATIRANGRVGSVGARGANGDSFPYWNSQGDTDYWAARRDAGGNDKNDCHGKVGGTGGAGSTAADFALPAGFAVNGRLVLQAHRGAGGPGGLGGDGSTLRNGRQFYCDGCSWTCRTGQRGAAGESGRDGTIFVGTVARATGQLTLID